MGNKLPQSLRTCGGEGVRLWLHYLGCPVLMYLHIPDRSELIKLRWLRWEPPGSV